MYTSTSFSNIIASSTSRLILNFTSLNLLLELENKLLNNSLTTILLINKFNLTIFNFKRYVIQSIRFYINYLTDVYDVLKNTLSYELLIVF